MSFIETLEHPSGAAPSSAPEAPPNGDPHPSLKTLSPSRAAYFKQCPQLFRYRAVDRLPEPTSTHQARGTAAHLALERLFDLPADQRSAERLFDLFRAAWTELRRDPEYAGLFDTVDEERAWGMESLEVIANYLTLEDPAAVSPIDRELELTEDLDGIAVRGILDRLDEQPDGKLVIIDYKTGAAPPERYALPAFFALKIYALLVERRFGRPPDELRLMYLGSSTVYSIRFDRGSLNGTERQILALAKAIRRAIEQDRFPPRPSALCSWCSFQDICPAFSGGQNGEHPAEPQLSPAAGRRAPI